MPESIPEKPGGGLNADISALRISIDEIDEKILELINRRLSLAQQIGAVKKQQDIQIADHRREKDIMNRLMRSNNGPLDKSSLQRIFEAIMAAGRNVQKTDQRSK